MTRVNRADRCSPRLAAVVATAPFGWRLGGFRRDADNRLPQRAVWRCAGSLVHRPATRKRHRHRPTRLRTCGASGLPAPPPRAAGVARHRRPPNRPPSRRCRRRSSLRPAIGEAEPTPLPVQPAVEPPVQPPRRLRRSSRWCRSAPFRIKARTKLPGPVRERPCCPSPERGAAACIARTRMLAVATRLAGDPPHSLAGLCPGRVRRARPAREHLASIASALTIRCNSSTG